MTLVVTGHQGFVGQYVLREPGTSGLVLADNRAVDLLRIDDLTASLDAIRPNAVIHLAAQSSVPDAFSNPLATYKANFIGTHNLLAALRKCGFKGRFLYVSTAEVYGRTPEDQLPLSEQIVPAPLNPYAVSKVAAEWLCDYWNRVEGIDIVKVRPFNHIGPGQSTRFAIADFAKTIVEIKLGRREPVLNVGDLDVTRDFTDVRDVVAAYLLLLERAERGETYNVCSGTERHMGRAVETLVSLAGVQCAVEQDDDRLRKASQRRSCGDNTRLVSRTGWQQKIAWEASLQDILNDWESKLT